MPAPHKVMSKERVRPRPIDRERKERVSQAVDMLVMRGVELSKACAEEQDRKARAARAKIQAERAEELATKRKGKPNQAHMLYNITPKMRESLAATLSPNLSPYARRMLGMPAFKGGPSGHPEHRRGPKVTAEPAE